MTVSSTTTKNSYSGNGSTHSFAYGFKIFADGDLTVLIRSSTGTETLKELNTHYVVTNAGNASGGNVLFKFNTGNTGDAHYSATDNRPASGETVVIRRNLTLTQGTDYVENDPFPAESHENALDRVTFITQQLQEELDRSIKLSRTNTMTSTEFTNSATDRASKILAFDTSGELAITQELGTFKGNWAASTAYAVRDIVKDTSTNNIFIVTAAHTSSGSQPLTTNTNSAKYSLIVDAASATTSATNAATSATAAANDAADAEKLAINPEDSQFTLSDGSTTGYSALHHKEKALDAQTASETAKTTSQNYAIKTDGAVESSNYSSKAWALGGTGVTDTAGSGASKEWATDTTNTVDGTEYSAKEYAIGTQSGQTNGSAKQWALGGGAGFDRDTAVSGSEYSAKYWANQAANSAKSQRDVYYGGFSSDAAAETYQTGTNLGTVDAGDLYFNTTSNVTRVYNGTSWNDVATDTSSFATNGFAIAVSIAL